MLVDVYTWSAADHGNSEFASTLPDTGISAQSEPVLRIGVDRGLPPAAAPSVVESTQLSSDRQSAASRHPSGELRSVRVGREDGPRGDGMELGVRRFEFGFGDEFRTHFGDRGQAATVECGRQTAATLPKAARGRNRTG